jgi:hypothetical protein
MFQQRLKFMNCIRISLGSSADEVNYQLKCTKLVFDADDDRRKVVKALNCLIGTLECLGCQDKNCDDSRGVYFVTDIVSAQRR